MTTVITPQMETRAFLKLIDPNTQEFHFRTFDDKKDSSRKALTGNLSGTIDKVEHTLTSRNATGAGVFFVVNEGGQKKENISRIRAVFADTDGVPLEPIVDALTALTLIASSV